MHLKAVLKKKYLAYARFNLYWPAKAYDQKDNCIFVVVKKDLLNKIVRINRTVLVSHFYSILLDITKKEIYDKKKKRKSKIVKIYMIVILCY